MINMEIGKQDEVVRVKTEQILGEDDLVDMINHETHHEDDNDLEMNYDKLKTSNDIMVTAKDVNEDCDVDNDMVDTLGDDLKPKHLDGQRYMSRSITPRSQSIKYSSETDSKEGKSLFKIGKSTKKQTQYKSEPIKTWRDNSSGVTETRSKIFEEMKQNGKDYMVETHSGIRIKNPLVSNSEMDSRMEGSMMVKMSQLGPHLNRLMTDGADDNWVTIGVIINKVPPKKSKTGKPFSIWKVSDLKSDGVVSFFLFGEVHNTHWKTPVATVIALLNSKVMSKGNPNQNSKYKNEDICALTTDHPDKVLTLGVSKDLSFCQGLKRNGQICNAPVNLSEADFCSTHILNAYKKFSAQRADIQTSFSNFGPNKKKPQNSFNSLRSDLTFEADPDDCPDSALQTNKPKLIDMDLETSTINSSQLKDKRSEERKAIAKYISSPVSLAARHLASTVNSDGTIRKRSDLVDNDSSHKTNHQVHGSSFSSVLQKLRAHNELAKIPMLARGYEPGMMIDLSGKEVVAQKKKEIEIEKNKEIEEKRVEEKDKDKEKKIEIELESEDEDEMNKKRSRNESRNECEDEIIEFEPEPEPERECEEIKKDDEKKDKEISVKIEIVEKKKEKTRKRFDSIMMKINSALDEDKVEKTKRMKEKEENVADGRRNITSETSLTVETAMNKRKRK